MQMWTRAEARELGRLLGFKRRMTVTVCVVRLLLWHWLQVFLYFVIFWAFSEIMDTAQFVLGWGVVIRESVYFYTTLVCLRHCPSFLLFSPARSNWFQLMFYVLSPEKWLANQLIIKQVFKVNMWYGRLFMWGILDLPALLALVVAICHGSLLAVPAVGYSVTVLACIVSVILSIGYTLGTDWFHRAAD